MCLFAQILATLIERIRVQIIEAAFAYRTPKSQADPERRRHHIEPIGES
jgi:hypothetical protein